jgi:hypothetical protein
MDDERIKQLTQEVLADLVRPADPEPAGGRDLAARVKALEAAVHALQHGESGPRAVAATVVIAGERATPPSLRLLDLGGSSRQCVMEPDKPCVQSGACRTFGH